MKQWIPRVALLVCLVILLRLLTFSMTFDSNTIMESKRSAPVDRDGRRIATNLDVTFSGSSLNPKKDLRTTTTNSDIVATREDYQPDQPSSHDETENQSCRSLPLNASAADSWLLSVSLCGFREQDCSSSRIRIKLKEDCERTRRTVSRSAELNSEILQKFGPDSFRLRLDGPEVLSRSASYLGNCLYDIVLPALNYKGSYRLDLERLYKDYHSMDEVTNQWPRLLKQPLLPSLVPVSNYHLQQMTLPSEVFLACKSNKNRESNQRPRCTGLEKSFTGRWVKESLPGRLQVHTRVRVKKIQRNPIKFLWAIQPDEAAHWYPAECSLLSLTGKDDLSGIKEILKGKKVVVGGDSQSRALYYSIINTLNGHGEACLRNITKVEAEPSQCIPNVKGSQRKQLAGLAQIDFVDDHFLDKLASGRYNGYDFVIVGFAQHPASKEHWSFEKYRNAVNSRMKVLQKLHAQGVTVIWVLAPQYPHSSQGYPVVVKDWRTDDRLKLFNNYSESAARKLELPILDQYSISSPMAHTSPDQAHFTNWVAYEFVRMLFSIIGTKFES